MANNDVWNSIIQTDGTPANSFEFLVDVLLASTAQTGMVIRSADITNVNPAFTAKNRNRETYGAKGVDSMSKYGENLVLTFDVEAVRDANGLYQNFLQDLINASKAVGAANRRTIRAYDALGADYAFSSSFAIQISRSATGWDEAGFYTVTATQYGKTSWIANPVLTGNVPIINNVSPASIAVGGTIYIQGQYFTGTTGAASVKIGVTNATSYVVISDSLISAVMPAGSAGLTTVTVTSPIGAGAPVSYTRGA